MKTRTFVLILILVLTVLLISSCVTTSKRIIRTADSGKYWTTKGLIAKGANVNVSDIFGSTALHRASI